jgi:fucose 4-O-acetylase-like acetyltransferase
VPYLIFEVAYSLPRLILSGKFELTLLDPYYLTWFLLSLFLWRLSTLVWQQLRWPLAIALALSLLTGLSRLPGELAMNRTFALLPFYVLGLMLRPEHFAWLRLAGAVRVAAFLAVTPARHTVFSGLGTATMYAYLLHGFVVKVAERLGLGLPLSIALGVIVATLLCTPPVRALFHWALEPRMSWAFTPLRRPA